MTATPEELLYTPSHEWIRDNGDGTVTMGITDHAQDQLGDVVFVELPEEEQTIAKGEELAVVESVKSASDIYAPVSGVVESTNEALEDAPETVNEHCYGDGWMVKIKLENPDELSELLSADRYQQMVADEA
ncbi:glycine cleavage system H protein [Halospina denitrificans]|uniref:Glycine cleavage system H protein n=1 Tax=Halospina denitrificans TaxID=332522 RepID=A0A4R7JP05_9GAMM|nr:glycine cleavage system protein GcvH [Halospina denitrificans]TDT39316.1 glycine cleavage system H protein [Halospina denitrificans]